ncbi:MAG TPA: glycerol-3-phosphate 1-O-acyltransferase PlsY [Chthoniobacteraceae bacterium]|jgi:glycerol-3-phosphate acyltransferase PlsY|nr:glycerol-3-phosphate 1-O-acyltransferase PlsY [Chthoniobacteraceae bacterium]
MHYAPVLFIITVVCYLLGSVPFGLIAGRMAGIDIRQHGSGNIGATNVWRVLGRKWGLPVFVLDVVKGLAAAIFGKWLIARWGFTVEERELERLISIGGIAGSLCAILGHNFPVWLRFKGGKGVATSLGVLFGLIPLASTLTFMTWGLVLKITRYVSVASIIGALSLPLWVLLVFLVPVNYGGIRGWPYFYFTVVATVLLVVRHIPNIKRLIVGTERRMGEPKEPVAAPAPQWGESPKREVPDAKSAPGTNDPRAD